MSTSNIMCVEIHYVVNDRYIVYRIFKFYNLENQTTKMYRYLYLKDGENGGDNSKEEKPVPKATAPPFSRIPPLSRSVAQDLEDGSSTDDAGPLR